MSCSLSKEQLHDIVVGAVRKLVRDAVRTNVAGREKCPIIISENDLCCYLFKELYDPDRYSINTEVTVKEGHCNDMVLLDSDESEHKLTRNNTLKEWKCKSYLAIMEFKVKWDISQDFIQKNIEYDLEVLSNLDDVSLLRYMIMFDYKCNLGKEELCKLREKYGCVCLIYANVKAKGDIEDDEGDDRLIVIPEDVVDL